MAPTRRCRSRFTRIPTIRLSLYGASKKANELMAHAYAHLFGIPMTGLRFFTVYGPWGRPDMAMWIFAKAILAGEPIKLFNNGNMKRDFTYIDDVVESVVRLVDRAPSWKSGLFDCITGSSLEQRTMASLQYRQQQAGRAARSRAPARGRRSARKRNASLCRCSPVMCLRLTPMSTI